MFAYTLFIFDFFTFISHSSLISVKFLYVDELDIAKIPVLLAVH